MQRMTQKEKAQWQRLYTLGARLDQVNPWPWMTITDCFGVQLPKMPEPCFIMFGGEEKSFRNIRVLIGWKAFYNFIMRLADPTNQEATSLLEIRMLEALFLNRELLFDHEQTFLKKINQPVDETYSTLIFRSIMPGYHPWLPNQEERDLLEIVLYQAFGMAMRVESDDNLLKSDFPRKILIRTQTTVGEWQECWMPMQEMHDEEVDVRIESELLNGLKKKPLRPITIQLDLVMTTITIQPSIQRAKTAYVLLVVDKESGLILAGELFQATEGIPQMWAQIPEKLLEIFTGFDGCPERIEICGNRMANLLRPLGEFVSFKMIRRERLDKLEKALETLSDYLLKNDKKM